MEKIDKYLDEVCECVTSVPHRCIVRRELYKHIEDSMESAGKKDNESKEAIEHVITDMGTPQEVGSRLNEYFSVRPDFNLFLYILGISGLYTIAGIVTEFSHIYIELIMTLVTYGVGVCLFFLLKRINPEGKHNLIKYLYLGTLAVMAVICLFMDLEMRRNAVSFCGVALSFCLTFWVYRLYKSGTLGAVAVLLLFLLPIPLLMYATAYAGLVLYIAAGIGTVTYYAVQGWPLKHYARTGLLIAVTVLSGIMTMLCSSALLWKWNLWNHCFPEGGIDRFSDFSEGFREYPLAVCISRYGFWALAAYIVLILLFLVRLIRMKRKVHYAGAGNVLNCIVLIFFIKSIFAILLNLGFPFIRSYMLPFAGFGLDQIANVLLVVMAEYVYCYGDAVFADGRLFEENKLLTATPQKAGYGEITESATE